MLSTNVVAVRVGLIDINHSPLACSGRRHWCRHRRLYLQRLCHQEGRGLLEAARGSAPYAPTGAVGRTRNVRTASPTLAQGCLTGASASRCQHQGQGQAHHRRRHHRQQYRWHLMAQEERSACHWCRRRQPHRCHLCHQTSHGSAPAPRQDRSQHPIHRWRHRDDPPGHHIYGSYGWHGCLTRLAHRLPTTWSTSSCRPSVSRTRRTVHSRLSRYLICPSTLHLCRMPRRMPHQKHPW
jgi:hypothetical protein